MHTNGENGNVERNNERTDAYIKIAGIEYHFEKNEENQVDADDVLNGACIHFVCPCCGGDAVWKKRGRGHAHAVCKSCGATIIE